MTKVVYVASPEGRVGKSVIALGLIEALATTVQSVGVFRPLVKSLRRDQVTETLLSLPGINQTFDEAVGVSYDEMTADPDAAMSLIVHKYGRIQDKYDAIVVVGSDFAGVFAPTEMAFNASIAANLNAPVLLVVSGRDRSIANIERSARVSMSELVANHVNVIGVVANRVDEQQVREVREHLTTLGQQYVTAAIPESRVLAAPTVRAQFEATHSSLWTGDPRLLDRESLGVLVAGMSLPNVLDRLEPEFTIVAPSDRLDLLPGLLMAHRSGTFPAIAAVILVGGYPVPSAINRLMSGTDVDLPIGFTSTGTYRTAERLFGMQGTMTSSARKIEVARRMFADHVDADAILRSLEVDRADIRTPLMFEFQLMQRARADKKTIVLPEASDQRIIESASILLTRDVAHIILLGDETEIRNRAHLLGFDISEAQVVSPHNRVLIEKFAREYARLRAHKGVTVEQAREKLKDLSYFATMMVHFGMADGMVSGAVNTTANTIKPSLEFVKTKPGVTVVSSSFLMCMPDEVVVYGDCAVNPDPTAEQLASIAISSAETAEAFGIEPRVAMLSYSTGSSGSGADVDKVRAATELVKQQAPHLKVEGPIQFDAAVDPAVGTKKMPGSEVAGQATVFVFPDLNTGNNTYKAVQRTSGAVAIGPVLQGLNRPVNDLSRGALVDDIVNTVAITAIQAQMDAALAAAGGQSEAPASKDYQPITDITELPRPDDDAQHS
ncbi:phosphate acetyltransferase [Tessaracoccus sp. SD287]|uniref:phosphate acetyltransferase n=1 Tax=Tessaracoccus sp. SD287 TaxID=2782008 RepID=UPI001D9C7ED2|nr:phosphate acetyltransferase [Tessaracoccus sp. SD287]